MARPLAILRPRISRSATKCARYALLAPQFAPPEQVFPREYESKAGTKTLASAAAGAGMEGRDPRRRVTLSREAARSYAEPELPPRDRHETPNRDRPPGKCRFQGHLPDRARPDQAQQPLQTWHSAR